MMQLQPGETVRFREVQRMWSNPLIKTLMPFEFVFVTVLMAALAASAPPSDRLELALVWFAVGVVVPLLVCFITLTTVVTDRRLIVRWWPRLPGRDIPLEDITSAEAVKYNWMSAGGWGWRISPKYKRAFNVAGDKGVYVKFGTGKDRFLLGSQRSDALALAIQAGVARAPAAPASPELATA